MAITRADIEFPCRRVPEDAALAKLVGLHTQRQDGLWMQRVKVPGGVPAAGQWRALGQIVRQFTPGSPLHLTTRQDIELHDLTAEQAPAVQRMLEDAGLPCIGAGGDSVRNVTVCPCSGMLAGTVDLLPLAREIDRTVQAEEGIYSLPRKFKISLSCTDACGQPWINDIGLVARRRDARWGFLIVVGGSLGPRPATGMRLLDWAPSEDALPLVASAVRVFAAQGDREHRHRARLRHVRQRVGDEAFAAMIGQALTNAKADRRWPDAPLPAACGFDETLKLTFSNGDVAPAAAAALADLAARDDLRVRIAPHHQVHVFARDRRKLTDAVGNMEALAIPARPQPCVAACPGTRWCKRALADTNHIADRIRAAFDGRLEAGTAVCISGCPNSCAHSAVADIGLIGRLVNRNGRNEEVYDVLADGGMGRSDKLAATVAEGLSADGVIGELDKMLPAR
jgi:sulfite reductase (ferredoxin)